MRIAMFCSGRLPTPPKKEKLIYAPLWVTGILADEMTKRGHQVTLFGAKGSESKAKVLDLNLPALEHHPFSGSVFNPRDPRIINFYEQLFISEIYRQAKKNDFDLIHVHPVDAAIAFAAGSPVPTVFTLHDPIYPWRKFVYSCYKKFKNIFYVSLSNAQRKPLKKLNYIGTVYNGIDPKKYSFEAKPKDYLFCASRLVAEKGIDLAILVAKKTGLPLKIAGDKVDEIYWKEKIKPALGGKIEYLGLVPQEKMSQLYQNARAFIFPLQWEEPFGLTMIESMACGTPVIAFRKGSVPEVIKDKKTGFIVKNIKEMAEAVKKIETIKREDCRKWVEENFTIEKMIDGYEKVYQKILNRSKN